MQFIKTVFAFQAPTPARSRAESPVPGTVVPEQANNEGPGGRAVPDARHRFLVSWMAAAVLVFSMFCASVSAQEGVPEQAEQAPAAQGFSSWDIQLLYGSGFREPGVSQDVAKWTVTLENSSAWRWGSSYFFVDYLRSDSADQNATEFYGEWYPSASIGKLSGNDLSAGALRDVSATIGINAGSKSTGAEPFVLLPGLTFDFDFPGFQFFSLGTYAYIDRGTFDGQDNGCNATTYQITPSWSLPFTTGKVRWRFDGFVDFIGSHGTCASQVVSQPTVKVDLGSIGAGKPDRLFAGIEWGYWKNKFGISGLNQTAPQAVVMWVF